MLFTGLTRASILGMPPYTLISHDGSHYSYILILFKHPNLPYASFPHGTIPFAIAPVDTHILWHPIGSRSNCIYRSAKWFGDLGTAFQSIDNKRRCRRNNSLRGPIWRTKWIYCRLAQLCRRPFVRTDCRFLRRSGGLSRNPIILVLAVIMTVRSESVNGSQKGYSPASSTSIHKEPRLGRHLPSQYPTRIPISFIL